MSWPMALVIVGVLFAGAFALCVNAASKSTGELIDFATRAVCYDTGWNAGAYSLDDPPPVDEGDCDRLYSDGFEDGESGIYDPPARE